MPGKRKHPDDESDLQDSSTDQRSLVSSNVPETAMNLAKKNCIEDSQIQGDEIQDEDVDSELPAISGEIAEMVTEDSSASTPENGSLLDGSMKSRLIKVNITIVEELF